MLKLFFAAALLLAAVAPSSAAMRSFPPHGPTDTFTHVPTKCVLPSAAFCSTGPMVRIGERCFCDGPQGRRYGQVIAK